jgi:predicted  nucleic acid-binding Zn-ribbon protein
MVSQAPAPAAAEIDNRPIFYLMLKALESSFVEYEAEEGRRLRRALADLDENHEARLRALAAEGEGLRARQRERAAEFRIRTQAVNARIAAVNEQIAELSRRADERRELAEQRDQALSQTPRIAGLDTRIAQAVARIGAIRARFVEGARRYEAAQAGLRARVLSYGEGNHPRQDAVERLNDSHATYAASEQATIDRLTRAYSAERQGFRAWAGTRRAELDAAREGLEQAARAYASARETHDRLVAEAAGRVDAYNARVAALNAGAALADGERETLAAEAAAIDTDRERVSEARARALSLGEEGGRLRDELDERRGQFESERAVREAALVEARTRIEARATEARSGLEARRLELRAKIEAIEAEIAADIRAERDDLEAQVSALEATFGADGPGLFEAWGQWLLAGERAGLYDDDGAPRFDRARAGVGAVYDAVEEIASLRREIDALIEKTESATAAVQRTSGELRTLYDQLREGRLAVEAQREALAEAEARERADLAAALASWEARQRAARTSQPEVRAATQDFLAARLALTAAEFEALQGLLVGAVAGPGVPPTEAANRAELIFAMHEAAGRLSQPPEIEQLAPDLLYLRLAQPTTETQAGDALAWVRYRYQPVASTEAVNGDRRAALAGRWFARLRGSGALDGLLEQVASVYGRSDRQVGVDLLGGLFTRGLAANAELALERFESGTLGLRLTLLRRDYWVREDGSLERVPPL